MRLLNSPPKIGVLGKLRAVKLALGGEIGVCGSVWGGVFCACGGFRWIENFSKIRMELTRASRTDLASSLRRDTLWKEFGVAEGLHG